MTSRERVLCALSHEEPDRVPIDFGGTLSSTINIAAYECLKEYLGIPGETDVMSVRSHTALVMMQSSNVMVWTLVACSRGLLKSRPRRNFQMGHTKTSGVSYAVNQRAKDTS